MFETLQPMSVGIAWTLLHFAWIAVVVWLVIQLVQSIAGRKPATVIYRIHLIGLTAIIAGFPVAAMLAYSNLGVSKAQRQTATRDLNSRPQNSDRINLAKSPDKLSGSQDLLANHHSESTTVRSDNQQTERPARRAQRMIGEQTESTQSFTFSPMKEFVSRHSILIAFSYGLGVVLMLGRLGFMMVGCHRIQRDSGLVTELGLVVRLKSLAIRIGLRRVPELRLSSRVATPLVTGLIKPMLMLPVSFTSGLTPSELDSILIHELAHLRRLDHLVIWMQRVAEIVFFFHPAVWHVSRRLSATRELCCDDFVLSLGTDPLDYARGLCTVASAGQSKRRQAGKLVSAANGEHPGELLQRVRRILGESSLVAMGPSPAAVLLATALMLVPLVAVWIEKPVEENNAVAPTTVALPTQQQEKEFLLTGTVVDQTDQAVAGARIKYLDTDGDFATTTTDDNGKFWLSVDCRAFTSIYFYSPDRKQVLGMDIFRQDLIERKEKPLQVRLKPAVEYQVLVQQDGQPIAGAEVGGRLVDASRPVPCEKTAADGTTTLIIPTDAKLQQVIALETQSGVGQRSDFDQPIDKAAPIAIELMPSKQKTVLVVDENQQPVPGVRITGNVVPVDRSDETSPAVIGGLLAMTTDSDEQGKAVFPWAPADKRLRLFPFMVTDKNYDWDQTRSIVARGLKPDDENETMYVTRKPRAIVVQGRVSGLNGNKSGIRIAGNGFHPKANRRQRVETITDKSGNFSAELVPGYSYAIGITDKKWASDALTLKIAPDHDAENLLEIPAYPATPLTVSVTSGQDNRPIADGRIEYIHRKRMALAPQHFVEAGIRLDKTLDEKGQAVFGAAAGEIELQVRYKNWATTKKVSITAGQPANVEIHAPAIGLRTVRGAVIAPADHGDVDLAKCEIKVFDRYFGTQIPITTTDASGNWQVELDTHNVGIRATSADGKFSGLGFDDNLGETTAGIKLRPTVIVSGRLIDEAGAPLSNVELVQYYDPSRRNSPTLRYLSTTTNEKGEFVFNSVITGIPQRLAVKIPRGGIRFVGPSKSYRPGEDSLELDVVYKDRLRNLRARPTTPDR